MKSSKSFFNLGYFHSFFDRDETDNLYIYKATFLLPTLSKNLFVQADSKSLAITHAPIDTLFSNHVTKSREKMQQQSILLRTPQDVFLADKE